jgi:hypothetical protein
MHTFKWKWSLNNHGLVVWMNSLPFGLTWVELHSGLGTSFIVVIRWVYKSKNPGGHQILNIHSVSTTYVLKFYMSKGLNTFVHSFWNVLQNRMTVFLGPRCNKYRIRNIQKNIECLF